MSPTHSALSRAESFCEAHNLRLPILLAPMAGACPPSLSIAVAGAGVLLVGSALLQLYLDQWAALAAILALAAVAIVWLRALIHIGLLEERRETETAPLTACPNCHRVAFRAAFCSYSPSSAASTSPS